MGNNLPNTNWDKYSDESIDFALSEAKELLNESIIAFREMANKSYGALAVYSAFISYGLTELSSSHFSNIPYYALIFGSLICIYVFRKNVLPQRLNKAGTLPQNLINEYYEKEVPEGKQLRYYKIGKIRSLNSDIIENNALNKKRTDNFGFSAIISLITLLCFGVIKVIF